MSAKPISLEVFEANMRKNPGYDIHTEQVEQLKNLFDSKVNEKALDVTFKAITSIEKVFCGNMLPSVLASMEALSDPDLDKKDIPLIKTEIFQLCRSMELALQGVLSGADIDFVIPLERASTYNEFKKLVENKERLQVAQIVTNTALKEMAQQQIAPLDENIVLYSGCFHMDTSNVEPERLLKGWVSVILCPKELAVAVKKFIDKPYTQGHGGSSPEFFDLAELSKENC